MKRILVSYKIQTNLENAYTIVLLEMSHICET